MTSISNILEFSRSINRPSLFATFLAFVGVLLAFGDYMGLVPLELAGFNFYGADFVIVLAILVVRRYGFTSLLKSRYALFLLLYISIGFLGSLYGFLQGHEPNDVIGDFRRLFFYSIAFWIAWLLLDSPQRMSKIISVAYLAVPPVIVISVFRSVQGISWRSFFTEENIHPVSFIATIVLFMVLYDAITKMLFAGRRALVSRHTFWLIIVSFIFLMSNYRLLWILPVMGSVGLIGVAWRKQQVNIRRIVRMVVLVAGVSVLVVVLLRMTQNQTYLSIEQKFIDRVQGFEFVNSFRYFTWGAAWKLFEGHWLIGVGLGHRLEYDLINNAGTWYTRTGTSHSIILDIFYQLGVVGGISFVALHGSFLAYVWRHLSRLPVEWVMPTLTMLFTYLSMLVFGSGQPFLTIPSVAVLFYVVLGIMARYVYWGRRSNVTTELTLENQPD